MPIHTKTYTISTAVGGGAVDESRLDLEIRQSPDILHALSGISSDIGTDTLSISFRDMLTSPEEVALGQLVAVHTGLPLEEPVNSDGVPLVALAGIGSVQVVGRTGSEMIRATHDFCHPCTWFGESVRTSEVLTNPSADTLTWKSAKACWIDLMHGKIHDEERISSTISHGYLPVVKVNGVAQLRRPYRASDWSLGGDYYIDHEAGEVVFQAAPAAAPEAEYSYAVGSGWVLQPDPGKVIEIENAELQWIDVDYNAAIVQDVEYSPDGGTTWIVVDRSIYKSFAQIVDEARGSFPEQAAVVGTPTWRGTAGTIQHTPLIYSAVKALRSSQGIRMRMWLGYVSHAADNSVIVTEVDPADGGFGGERATATFYAVSKDE